MDRRHLLTAAAAASTSWLAAPVAAQPPVAPAIDYRAELRRHGLVVVLRHARTEAGIGDPPGYRLDDCSSQRQLSSDGRAQATRLGQLLAAQGLRPSQVLSSRWCRCLDTARLAFGRVEAWPALDSFFDTPGREATQTAALRTAAGGLAPGELVAWVTHMVNIAALTGDSVAMGEALVLRVERQPNGRLRLLRLGRIDSTGRG